MKAIIERQILLEGLNVASGASAVRTPKVSLQGVLVRAIKDRVLLLATDLEVAVRYEISEATIHTEGEVLVPISKLFQIVRESKDDTISLNVQDNILHIEGSDSHFQIYTGDVSEFPPVPELEGAPDFELTVGQLHGMISRTLFSAAKESSRYAIDGLLWKQDGDSLRIIATDGRRLSMAVCRIDRKADGDSQVIVPSKAVGLFQRIESDPEEQVAVKFLSNQIILKTRHATLSSVLMEGLFPNFEAVIPQDCDKTVSLDVSEVLSGVRRAALLTSDESKAIRLQLENGKMVITGRAPEQGESSIEMPLEYDGEPMQIAFNPVFLMDVLKVVAQEKVDFSFRASNRPGLFREGSDYLYVVMPVNLK